MSRYRLYPTPAQEDMLLGHCAHARYVWNLAVEQRSWWQPGRLSSGFVEQCRQLSEARAASPWLEAGSVIVQQQALRDFHAAHASWFAALRQWRKRYTKIPPAERPAPPGQPGFRKRGLGEGFRIVATGPQDVRRLQRRLARAKRGSKRRARVKARLARLHTRNADARRDWAEKASTEIARGYDLIRLEDLDVWSMTRSARGTPVRPGRHVGQKAGLNRSILRSGWGMFATRLEHKARGRVEKVDPAYTSQRCSRCGTVDRQARESQAAFRCRSCGYRANADHNAARNIAAGHAARGGLALAEPANREPQLVASSVT